MSCRLVLAIMRKYNIFHKPQLYWWFSQKIISLCFAKKYSIFRHTHTRLTALFPGLPEWAGTRKVKPIWILLKQETVSGSGISWAYTSLQTDNHASTSSLSFLQAGCPSCRPTNSVKSLNILYSDYMYN